MDEFEQIVLLAIIVMPLLALLAVAVYAFLQPNDDPDTIRITRPRVPLSGPPMLIQAVEVWEVHRPIVDTAYDPSAGDPDTDSEKREADRRDRLRSVVSNTQSKSADTPKAAPALQLPCPAAPTTDHDKERQTRLMQVIRSTQTRN